MVLSFVFAESAVAYDFEENGIYYAVKSFHDNPSCVVTYREFREPSYAGDVVIPATVVYNGKTFKVTEIEIYAFENCSKLTSVSLPNTITTIGGYAFSGCSQLSQIEFPSSVTYLGSEAFKGCSSLASITITNSIHEL